MNEKEQMAIQQMVQGARGGEMIAQNSPQQPPQQEAPVEAPPGEYHMKIKELLDNWRPQTSEGRQYFDELEEVWRTLGGQM